MNPSWPSDLIPSQTRTRECRERIHPPRGWSPASGRSVWPRSTTATSLQNTDQRSNTVWEWCRPLWMQTSPSRWPHHESGVVQGWRAHASWFVLFNYSNILLMKKYIDTLLSKIQFQFKKFLPKIVFIISV